MGKSITTKTEVREVWLPLSVNTLLNSSLFYCTLDMILSIS